jgi:hypothetical protein
MTSNYNCFSGKPEILKCLQLQRKLVANPQAAFHLWPAIKTQSLARLFLIESVIQCVPLYFLWSHHTRCFNIQNDLLEWTRFAAARPVCRWRSSWARRRRRREVSWTAGYRSDTESGRQVLDGLSFVVDSRRRTCAYTATVSASRTPPDTPDIRLVRRAAAAASGVLDHSRRPSSCYSC